MGGIHLTSPDFPEGFPINAQQLHYLILHGHIDIPNWKDMDISERNSADILSRYIQSSTNKNILILTLLGLSPSFRRFGFVSAKSREFARVCPSLP
jgi:hypothetical protein